MAYLAWLIAYGLLAGAVYALVALAFVVVHKASRAINFAVGEWVMFGALLTAAALHVLALPLAPALVLAGFGVTAFAWAFSRLVLRRMTGRSLMAMIMLTLGLGAFMRGLGPMIFSGIPNAIVLPLPEDPVPFAGLSLPPERLAAAAIALACVGAVAWFYRATRTGLALRAIALSPATARGLGIDVDRHIAIAWGLAGLVALAAGVLWSAVSGGGFGTALVGLKVFPIVVIGGLNSIPGCILGAMLIGVAESLASGYLDRLAGSGVSVVVSSALLLLMLWLRPHGFFGAPLATRI